MTSEPELEPRTETSSRPARERVGETGRGATRSESIHDFSGKLRREGLWPQVRRYVEWQRDRRAAWRDGSEVPKVPDLVPLSINLDLTTACNYRCDHCIDWDILNQPGQARRTMTLRDQPPCDGSQRGLRSRSFSSAVVSRPSTRASSDLVRFT